MTDSLKFKLQKLLTLSKRGIDGEKLNAEVLLNKLLKKHNVSLSQIESEEKQMRFYSYTSPETRQILVNIIGHVSNTPEIYGVKKHKDLAVEVTDYEDIQIQEMKDFHFSNFRKERQKILQDLASAYIHKHDIFRESSTENEEPANKKPVDWEAIKRMLNLKNSLSDVSFRKSLNQ